jgi:hypothetical protein
MSTMPELKEKQRVDLRGSVATPTLVLREHALHGLASKIPRHGL